MQILFSILFLMQAILPAANADELWPEPLSRALSAAAESESDALTNWRFQVTIHASDGPIQAGYDGAAAEAERWSLLSPPEAALTDEQEVIWHETRFPPEDDDPISGLFFPDDAIEIIAGDVRLVRETDEQLVYAFAPYLGEEDMDAEIARHLVGEIAIRREDPVVLNIRLHSPRRFRPQMLVQISAFEMVLGFTPIEGQPVPVLSQMSTLIEGRAAFQEFSERSEMTFTEVEYLGASSGPLSGNPSTARTD